MTSHKLFTVTSATRPRKFSPRQEFSTLSLLTYAISHFHWFAPRVSADLCRPGSHPPPPPLGLCLCLLLHRGRALLTSLQRRSTLRRSLSLSLRLLSRGYFLRTLGTTWKLYLFIALKVPKKKNEATSKRENWFLSAK